uniref:hypothetical protein n=3 Tax=Yoonia sp. TaxID=2212373 RepID=UPI004047EDCA
MILDTFAIPSFLAEMDEARVAIIISTLSASFTAGSLIYTRRLAINDTNKMKRKTPVFEIELGGLSDELPEWNIAQIIVRNLEPVAARLTAISVKRRRQAILSRDDALDVRSDPFGGPIYKSKENLPIQSKTELRYKIGPLGSKGSEYGSSPCDTIYVSVYVKGVTRIADIKLDWQWADGRKS